MLFTAPLFTRGYLKNFWISTGRNFFGRPSEDWGQALASPGRLLLLKKYLLYVFRGYPVCAEGCLAEKPRLAVKGYRNRLPAFKNNLGVNLAASGIGNPCNLFDFLKRYRYNAPAPFCPEKRLSFPAYVCAFCRYVLVVNNRSPEINGGGGESGGTLGFRPCEKH